MFSDALQNVFHAGCGELYSGRLAKLNLDSLELRRLKADLTYVYKILFGLVDVSCADTFWCVTVRHVHSQH